MTRGAQVPEGLIATLREARHVLVLTGAGVSAESGVPTFREAQTGLWARYDPLELATPEAFDRDPELVWRWYAWRRGLVASVDPNPGHLALARLAGLVPQLTLVTQNVDGLHQRAGSEDVIEFHGNIFENRCHDEIRPVELPADTADAVPVCPDCGGFVRPGVVWFGEAIPQAALEAAMQAAERCDVFFSVGTSAQVWPAAGLAASAQRSGAIAVEVNPATTDLSGASDYRLPHPAGEVLPDLIDCLAATGR